MPSIQRNIQRTAEILPRRTLRVLASSFQFVQRVSYASPTLLLLSAFVAIDVEWQDERGRTLARYDGPTVTAALLRYADPQAACLRFIDPYGNTTFNQQQLSVLRDELEALDSRIMDGQALVARALLDFLTSSSGMVHTYVKFIGD